MTLTVERAASVLASVDTRQMLRDKYSVSAVSGRAVRVEVDEWWVNELRTTAGDQMLQALRADSDGVERIKFVARSGARPKPPKPPTPAPAPPPFEAEVPEATRKRRLPLVFAGEIGEAVDLDDFVQGLLIANCLALVYGAPKCGKTFWTLDLALHVATGRRWRDREVDRGAVLYLALEGTAGIRNRVAAWLKHHDASGDDAALAIVPVSLDLLHSDADICAVIAAALNVRERCGLPVKLIVVDTVARALGGGDENGSDMGLLVSGLDRIRDETGAAVLAIHHPRKDGTGGERGHGALRGALDIRIEVSRDDHTGTSCARVIEARELEPGAVFPFKLEQVELGRNKRDETITSCVPVPTDAVETRARGPRITGAAEIARTALANILATSGQKVVRDGIPAGIPTVTVDAWKAEAYRAGISTGDPEAQRKAFMRATEKLVGARVAVIRDGLAWLS